MESKNKRSKQPCNLSPTKASSTYTINSNKPLQHAPAHTKSHPQLSPSPHPQTRLSQESSALFLGLSVLFVCTTPTTELPYCYSWLSPPGHTPPHQMGQRWLRVCCTEERRHQCVPQHFEIIQGSHYWEAGCATQLTSLTVIKKRGESDICLHSATCESNHQG